MPFVFQLLVGLLIIAIPLYILKRFTNPYGLPQAVFNWPSPILYLFILLKGNVRKNIPAIISDLRKKYGDEFAMPFFGFNNVVVLCGNEGVNWITKQEKDDTVKRLIVGNLEELISDPRNIEKHKKENWKMNRRILSPILMQSDALNNFFPTMISVIDEYLSKMSTVDAESIIPMVYDIGWLFVVGKRGFEYKDEIRSYYKNIKNALFGIQYNLPYSSLRKGLESRSKIANIAKKILETDPTARADPNCCLSAITEQCKSDIDKCAQKILGLLFASHETTYSALNGVLWCLISNPKCLEKLQKEIREAPVPTNITDFRTMPYLEKCIHESLRLFGSNMVFRETNTTLQYKNYTFPPKTVIMLVTGHEHFSVNEPEKFNPDREEKYRWEPFGTPQRNCIGKIFAQTELKMILYRLLSQYNVNIEKEDGASIYQKFQIRLCNARLRIQNAKN